MNCTLILGSRKGMGPMDRRQLLDARRLSIFAGAILYTMLLIAGRSDPANASLIGANVTLQRFTQTEGGVVSVPFGPETATVGAGEEFTDNSVHVDISEDRVRFDFDFGFGAVSEFGGPLEGLAIHEYRLSGLVFGGNPANVISSINVEFDVLLQRDLPSTNLVPYDTSRVTFGSNEIIFDVANVRPQGAIFPEPGGFLEVTFVTVPEPTSLLLLAVGFVVLTCACQIRG